MSAPSFRAGQQALVNLFDALAPLSRADSRQASADFSRVLGVDPLSPEAASAIGVDLDAGVILFSEGLNPTFVLRLAAPDAMAKFFEQLRTKGMVTQSVFVDGTEVFSAQLSHLTTVAWAIEGEWMWVHFTIAPHEDQGAAWFLHSHHPDPARWTATWSWSSQHSTPQSVQGFLSPQQLLAGIPEIAACTKLLAPVGRVGLSVDGDLQHATGRLTFDVGAAGASIAAAQIAPPPGWATAAAAAPVDAEWNLDLDTLTTWAEPCLASMNESPRAWLDEIGVRAIRALVRSYDPDHRGSWSGAVVADVAHSKFFASQLDQLDFPGRSLLEKTKKFGPYPGKRIAAPTFPAIEYSLGDKLVLLGVGDGLLDQIVAAPAPPSPSSPPLVMLRLQPQALSVKAWSALLEQAGLSHADSVATFLQVWREAHITLTVSGPDLILEAGGVRH